jgi:ubiquinone/menaquinone biosynthesis C-methylase UbiE/DNA-binding transcriptional ArsR family regulator
MRIDPLLRALADPTRLRIVRLLAHMELAVGELAQVLGQSQPRVSRHARILCDAGLAERRKEGSWVFLKSAINARGPAAAMGTLAAQLVAAAEAEDAGFAQHCAFDRKHLTAIRSAREATAQGWFARNATEWDTLRSLHSPDEPVEAALEKAFGDNLGSLLDVGTGTGRVAELLAPHASHVTALDKSPEMLRIARSRLQHLPSDRLDLVQGDFGALPFADASFDTLVFHQVLHYAQEPEAALAEAARVTRPGGRVAVVDFAAHDREELRASHAHARLGFSDAQMLEMLEVAGFEAQSAAALPGKPLTVMIWTGQKHAASVTPISAIKAVS